MESTKDEMLHETQFSKLNPGFVRNYLRQTLPELVTATKGPSPRICPSTLSAPSVLLLLLCSLMSSDVSWHISDKLGPMREHGLLLIYVHGNHNAHSDGMPRTATSTFTQLLNSDQRPLLLLLLQCCFTSTEARWLIRDGDRVGRGRRSEGSTADTARKRPERPWTAARTMEVLRRCPLAIVQRLVHCAIALSTAVLGQSLRQCPLHCC